MGFSWPRAPYTNPSNPPWIPASGPWPWVERVPGPLSERDVFFSQALASIASEFGRFGGDL